MRVVASVVVIGSLIFFAPPPISSQQKLASIQRDPQAITILTQALNAYGGASAISGILDFTATGNITYYWDEAVQGNLTMQGRGLHELRVDASLPHGMHSSVTNANASFQKTPDGSVLQLPSQNIHKLTSAVFPAFYLFAAFHGASISITYGGQVAHNGEQAHDIVVQKIFPANGDPGGALGSISKAHIFIDPNSLMIKAVVDSAYRRDGGSGEFVHEIQFGGYQSVAGVFVPFSVGEFVAGQQTMGIQLNQVTFNSGLTDAAFE